jgi:hypothetical protein
MLNINPMGMVAAFIRIGESNCDSALLKLKGYLAEKSGGGIQNSK